MVRGRGLDLDCWPSGTHDDCRRFRAGLPACLSFSFIALVSYELVFCLFGEPLAMTHVFQFQGSLRVTSARDEWPG